MNRKTRLERFKTGLAFLPVLGLFLLFCLVFSCSFFSCSGDTQGGSDLEEASDGDAEEAEPPPIPYPVTLYFFYLGDGLDKWARSENCRGGYFLDGCWLSTTVDEVTIRTESGIIDCSEEEKETKTYRFTIGFEYEGQTYENEHVEVRRLPVDFKLDAKADDTLMLRHHYPDDPYHEIADDFTDNRLIGYRDGKLRYNISKTGGYIPVNLENFFDDVDYNEVYLNGFSYAYTEYVERNEYILLPFWIKGVCDWDREYMRLTFMYNGEPVLSTWQGETVEAALEGERWNFRVLDCSFDTTSIPTYPSSYDNVLSVVPENENE